MIYISQFKIGLNYENTIFFKNYQLHYKAFISLPNKNPFVIEEYNPLIIHICAIEAYNIPKSDPYVLCRLERDQSGVKTKNLEKTTTPQWYEFIHLIITDENEDLVVEIWNKNGKKDKLICGSKLNLKKYLNGEIYYEWIKMDNIFLNIALQVKREGEKYMTMDEIDKYVNENIPDIN